MGAGKSTIGKKLATALGYYFIDLDDHITRTHGKTITELFKWKGEEGFRLLEQDSLQAFDSLKQIVISTGGGTAAFHDNMVRMKSNGFTIWLDTEWDIMMSRLAGAKKAERPLFEEMDRTELRALFDKRVAQYSQADLTLKQSETEKDVLLKRIRQAFLK